MPRIGELLIAEGVLSEVAVRSALGFQRHTGEPFRLGTILLDRDLLAEESLLKALSAIHRCDYATWPQILKAGPQIVRILPERAAVRLAAIPYALEGRGVRVAFKNPSNLAAVDEVSALTGRPVIPAVISEVRLLQALHLFYGRPVPIEFRSVLQKLERNEERRLYRTRATLRAGCRRAVRSHRRPSPDARSRSPSATARSSPHGHRPPSRRPPRRVSPRRSRRPRRRTFSPMRRSPRDVPGLLPDFTPPRSESADERAARMWTDAVPGEELATPAARLESPEPAAPPPAATPLPEIEPPTGRDHIAEDALDGLAARFPRILLLVSGQDAVQGWTGRGGRLTRGRASRAFEFPGASLPSSRS